MPPQKNPDDQECQTPGPGPGAYQLATTMGYEQHDISKWRGPAFSLGMRLDRIQKSDIPGPIYNVRGLSRFGSGGCATGFTINSRSSYKYRQSIPGPGAYQPEKFPFPKGASPAFSIQGRVTYTPKIIGPGPNQYILPSTIGFQIPNMKNAPAARISGRTERGIRSDSPGPATYGVPNLDAVKFIFPAVTISGRNDPKASNRSPGPCAYLPTYVTGPNSPMFSIRPRVGKCLKPYITPLDACD